MRAKLVCLALLLGIAAFNFSPLLARSARVAVLDSHNTREFFARHYPDCDLTPPTLSFYLGAEEYQRYFRGWEFVLNENGIPFDRLFDADIEDGKLKGYDVLILSNTASLSDSEERQIDRWVREGGRLLATFGSGYKDITQLDPREIDGLKLQKGGTDGLHQLWKDPLTKVFSTLAFTPGTDIKITQYSGITAGLKGKLQNDVLGYGALANILVQRPLDSPRMYGTVIVPGYDKIAPAIMTGDVSRGKVIYFAFAPEYIVSKQFTLPALPFCPDGQDWSGRSDILRILMRDSVLNLLNN